MWRCGGHGGRHQRGSRNILESALLQILGQERWVVSWCIYGPDVIIVTTNVSPGPGTLTRDELCDCDHAFPGPSIEHTSATLGNPERESFENWDTANLTKFSCRELTRNFEWAFQQSNYLDCLSTESEFSEKLVITLSAFNGSASDWGHLTWVQTRDSIENTIAVNISHCLTQRDHKSHDC